MVSSKLLELENAINNLSMEEKIWLLEKIVVQMRELTKIANFQQQLNLESGNLNANSEDDPLIGLFAGSPDLATDSEEILYLYHFQKVMQQYEEPLKCNPNLSKNG